MKRIIKLGYIIIIRFCVLFASGSILLSGCNSSSTVKQKSGMKHNNQQQDEAAIRQRIADYVASIRIKDLERVMAIFAPGLVSFDLEAPLQHMRAESKRQNWTKAFAAYEGPIGYEVKDLTIVTGNDLAMGRSVNRISGTLSNGKKTSYWIRWTTCFQKIGGTWYITHDHVSVPLDLKTGQGVLNIEP
jgi:ketosteroid isomerase-like protein